MSMKLATIEEQRKQLINALFSLYMEDENTIDILQLVKDLDDAVFEGMPNNGIELRGSYINIDTTKGNWKKDNK